MTQSILSIDKLSISIGGSRILRDVSLELGANHVFCLMGRNGVGKTTTLKSVVGLYKSNSGQIVFEGHDISRMPPEHRARAGIGYVPQGRGIFPNLTVLENLNIGLPGQRDSEREDYVFTCFPRLKERLKQSGDTLSGGEQQMLAIARCLMMRPKLIILDEPTEGIMPKLVSQIRREIHRINQTGVSVLLVEQNVETALKLCPRVFLMEKGTIVYSGASHELKSQPEIVHRYLGLTKSI